MKQYDSYSIKEKIIARLQANKNWKAVAGNSVINSILDQFSEASGEQARYTETLFLESKWDVSQDLRQIKALSNTIGYSPKRKVSASGVLYISNSNQIHEVGKTISVKDFNESNLDWETSLVDFTTSATVLDENGNSYVLTSINSLPSNKHYINNSIMEGKRKAIKIPASIVRDLAKESKLNPYVYVPVTIPNAENAGTAKTSPFFKVLVDGKEFRIVDSLLLSETGDRDVEIIQDLYSDDLYYLKFNTDPAKGEVLNVSRASSGFDFIEIQYVESKGAEGNVPDAFLKFTITTADGKSLFGITLDSIAGGADVETVAEIKANAPNHYLETYTTATKPAYSEAIKKIDFGSQNFATNVKIYAGEDDEGNDVVFASIISPELESAVEEGEITTDKIDSILNLSLDSFKAPNDNLKYLKPNYERIALGIKCTMPRGSVDNTDALAVTLQSEIDKLFGNQSLLDFGKDYYNADIIKTIKNYEPNILSVETELEATERLEWLRATRQTPKGDTEATVKTIRIPFDFSKIFTGDRYTFKNFTNGASYSLRFDFLIKSSGSTAISNEYHSTYFINEAASRTSEEFVLIKDDNQIWHDSGDNLVVLYTSYAFIDDNSDFVVEEVTEDNLKQFPLLKKVVTDSDYNALLAGGTSEQLVEGMAGYASDLIIYHSGANETTGRIGTGYIEFPIDSMYNSLQLNALKDPILRKALDDYPLANLKCSTDTSDIPNFIRDVLSPYVEIYSSFRLFEQNITINDQSYDPSAVIYIETDDASNVTTNLKELKVNRFLSVECNTI